VLRDENSLLPIAQSGYHLADGRCDGRALNAGGLTQEAAMRMGSGFWLTGLVMSAAIAMGGCEKKEQAPSPPPPQPQATSAEPAAPAGPAPAIPAATAPAAEQAAGAAATAEAQTLLEQVTNYIKENKLELAEQTLNKLEAMKGRLPAEWASKIEDARKMLAAAKLAGGAGGVLPR
jgi:hypothetical protein